MDREAFGRIAYEAYAKQTGWKSLATGAELPAWGELSSAIRDAWCVAADAVMEAQAAAVLA